MMNLKRGVHKSLLLGLVGFLIPAALLSIPWPNLTASQSRSERQDAIIRNEHLVRNNPAMMLRSGLHCAAVFALAAFAAYAPHNGIRFMRSLIILSSVTVLSLVVTGIFFPTYKGLQNNILIDPGIPILVAVITMATIIIVSVRKTATDFTQVLATNETELRET